MQMRDREVGLHQVRLIEDLSDGSRSLLLLFQAALMLPETLDGREMGDGESY